MKNNEYEQAYIAYCVVKTISMTAVIFSAISLLSNMITCQMTFLSSLFCILDIALGLFVYFYINDGYIDNEDDGEE